MRRLLPRRRRFAAALLVAGLLLTGTVAELAARALVGGRIEDAVGRRLGEDADVDIDGGPMLLALYDRRLDAVTVSSDDATLGRIEGVQVEARLYDVRLRGGSGTVARTEADVGVPPAALQSLAGASGGQGGARARLEVSGVRTDAEADTVGLVLNGGLGEVTLRPRVEDGRVVLHVDEVSVFGRPAPAALVERFQDTLGQREDRAYPLGMKATALDVDDSGLHVTLTGGRARLPGR
ncbi:DUF2993 domain-containing protein [Streptomyces sp. NPDC057877]|uniref:LmeA family phospholipid-binding protein n=1 Tax=Streptomyces sp. NPDC057877 TaxID=3346269 RepID=UPI0036CD85CA